MISETAPTLDDLHIARARGAIAAYMECDDFMKGQLHAFNSHPVIREGIMRVRVRIANRIAEERKCLPTTNEAQSPSTPDLSKS